jgi:hypothetical protein
VCTENLVRVDLMRESLNVGHDGRAETPRPQSEGWESTPGAKFPAPSIKFPARTKKFPARTKKFPAPLSREFARKGLMLLAF